MRSDVFARACSQLCGWIVSGQDEGRATVRDWLIDGFAESGLTQAQLGQLTGVSQNQVGKYLFGTDLPGDDKLRLLAKALKRPSPRMIIVPGVAEADTAFRDQTGQLLELWGRLDVAKRTFLIEAAQRLVGP